MSIKPPPTDFAPTIACRVDSIRSIPADNTQLPEIQTVAAHQLDAEMLDYWNRVQGRIDGYDSPYYHPEFMRAVAAVRGDVEIAVQRNRQGTITGLLPFQRLASGEGHPIGGRMNDFHGFIQHDHAAVDLRGLLSRLNLRRLGFHALSVGTRSFGSFSYETLPSHAIDLSAGWPDYQAWARGNSRTIARMPQKIRGLRREHGNLRFEFDSDDRDALEKLIELKRAKYRRTRTFDILSVEWAANLLREIHGRKAVGFQGLLSVVRSGERLIAAHFGMISGRVLHYWFPVYDPEFAKYSPGIHLLMETCRVAAERGIQRIDLSYGESDFKDKFSNSSSPVLTGSVDFNPLSWTLSNYRYRMRKRLKQLPMKENLKTVLRGLFPDYGCWHFR